MNLKQSVVAMLFLVSLGVILYCQRTKHTAIAGRPSAALENREDDKSQILNRTPEFRDPFVRTVQYQTDGGWDADEMTPTRTLMAIDQGAGNRSEPGWRDAQPLPWEVLGAGEFLGPIRRPFESDYRVRINDLLELTYATSRKMMSNPYRIQVGDEIEINDANRSEISKQQLIVLDDGFVSPLEIEQVHVAGKTIATVNKILNQRYREAGTRDPSITVRMVKANTALKDILEAIQGQISANGSVKNVRVAPDGTIQLPIVGKVCVYGLTLDEITREINLRYSKFVFNLNVTPALLELAPKSVFVFGEVEQPGLVPLEGPTTALGAIASAEGFLSGANRRQVVVLRRDSEWRMIATKLDLAGAALGKRPIPSDDVWLRPSDIIIVPKAPIQRLAEFIDLYFANSLYVLIPNQGVSFVFDTTGSVN